jgi:hypothetical protein
MKYIAAAIIEYKKNILEIKQVKMIKKIHQK